MHSSNSVTTIVRTRKSITDNLTGKTLSQCGRCTTGRSRVSIAQVRRRHSLRSSRMKSPSRGRRDLDRLAACVEQHPVTSAGVVRHMTRALELFRLAACVTVMMSLFNVRGVDGQCQQIVVSNSAYHQSIDGTYSIVEGTDGGRLTTCGGIWTWIKQGDSNSDENTSSRQLANSPDYQGGVTSSTVSSYDVYVYFVGTNNPNISVNRQGWYIGTEMCTSEMEYVMARAEGNTMYPYGVQVGCWQELNGHQFISTSLTVTCYSSLTGLQIAGIVCICVAATVMIALIAILLAKSRHQRALRSSAAAAAAAAADPNGFPSTASTVTAVSESRESVVDVESSQSTLATYTSSERRQQTTAAADETDAERYLPAVVVPVYSDLDTCQQDTTLSVDPPVYATLEMYDFRDASHDLPPPPPYELAAFCTDGDTLSQWNRSPSSPA